MTHIIKAQLVPLLASPILMVKRNKLCISERKKIPFGETMKPALMSCELPEPVQGAWLVHSPDLSSSSEQSWAGQTHATSHGRAGVVARQHSQELYLWPLRHSVRAPRLEGRLEGKRGQAVLVDAAQGYSLPPTPLETEMLQQRLL